VFDDKYNLLADIGNKHHYIAMDSLYQTSICNILFTSNIYWKHFDIISKILHIYDWEKKHRSN